MKRPELSIIGSGSVATHLGQAFVKAGCSVKQVYSQTSEHAKALAGELKALPVTSLREMEETNILLIAISDDAIAKVAAELNLRTTMVIHTSGTVPMEELRNASSHYGVLYPLQTFSKSREVDMQKVPLLIEAKNEGGYDQLTILGNLISDKLICVNSSDRLKYHLSAVIANNFTNYLWREASDYLTNHDLDFTVLHPLIRETVDKTLELGPAKAQTGPAQRNDRGTIQRHLDLLEEDELKALYEFLTERIMKQGKG